MYGLLVKLMVLAAMARLGLSATGVVNPRQMEKAARQVVKINWAPIFMFPTEATRFK
jgi:hypothetical protein